MESPLTPISPENLIDDAGSFIGIPHAFQTEIGQLWFVAVLMGLTYALTLVAGFPYAGAERLRITFTMFVILNQLGAYFGWMGLKRIPTRGLVYDAARPLAIGLVLTAIGNSFDCLTWLLGIVPLKTSIIPNVLFILALGMGMIGIFRLARLCLVTPGRISSGFFTLLIGAYLGIGWIIDPNIISRLLTTAENRKEALFGLIYAVIAAFCGAISWEIWSRARGQLRHAARLVSLGAILLSSGCFLYGYLFIRQTTMEVSASSLHILIALAYIAIGLGVLRMGSTMLQLFHPDLAFIDPQQPLITIFGESIGVKVFENLAERIKSSEAARQRTEMESREKSQFLSMMSHELRTPLTSILGYSLMMGDEGNPIGATIPPDGREFARRINASATHLRGLIDGILIAAQTESGRKPPQPERVSLIGIIEFVVHQAQILVQQTGPVFRHTSPDKNSIEILVAPQALRQILMNLLTNAFKFTHSGEVHFLVETHDRDVVFRVEDTGIGVPKDQLSKVFEPFFQVSTGTTRHFGGVGLGLAIVKRLLDEIGGTIHIESEENCGTRADVRFSGIVCFDDDPTSMKDNNGQT